MTKLTLPVIALFVLVPAGAQTRSLSTIDDQLLTGSPASAVSQNAATKRRETSITGRLVNDSGQAIPNAAVYVRKVGASANISRNIGTDEDGRFRADDLPPGAYTVSAYVPGFVNETDTLDRQYYRPGETVTLRMIKGGVVSGTVTNSSGEPIIAARVGAVRVRDAEGRVVRAAGASGNSRQTDDRGVYRLYGLQSGAYVIVVSGGSASYYATSAYDGDAPTYYPSTTRDAAAEVTVRTGDEIGGIDIRYRGERGHTVSGTFSGSFGSASPSRGVGLFFIHASGALESGTYIPLRGGERGFALYGVPDGEYELFAQVDTGTEKGAASPPRRVTVKGSDVTGIELALAPLGSIAGRVIVESLPESERKGECKDKRPAHLDETVVNARRDEKPGAKDKTNIGFLMSTDATPDDKGEFKITSLIAGRYRIETRLPTEDWFVRSITLPGSAASKQQSDVTGNGLAIRSGQRTADVTITLAEGAAGLRGKVVPASEGGTMPSRLRVQLVPAQADSADAVLQFTEAEVDHDCAFSFSNLSPGRYFLLARAVPDEEFMERTPRPIVWDSASRVKLRSHAVAANVVVELQRCQRVRDYVLKYYSPSGAQKRPSTTKP